MANEFARTMLTEQRRRLVGSLMKYVEENVYPFIPQEERPALRAKVLASAAAYHDVCLDIMKASAPQEDMAVNEELLILIRSIHQKVV